MKLFFLPVVFALMAGCSYLPCSRQAALPTGVKSGDVFTCVYGGVYGERGASWSDRARGESARDHKAFQGPFETRPVAFSQEGLPAHGWVRVRFDLLMFGKWDGSSAVWGPDLFAVTLRGGPRLLFATFGNCGFWVNNNTQSYPDEYPWAAHPDWTGAKERQVDGLRPSGFVMSPAPEKTDSVYPVEMIFPHTGGALTLDFAGIYDDAPGDQAWGVRNLRIEVADIAPTPAEKLPALWDDLASTDAGVANAALWQFIGAGRGGQGVYRSQGGGNKASDDLNGQS